jgi:hypothetical protein
MVALIFELIGIAGLLMVFSAFLLNNMKKKVRRRTYIYNVLMLFGSAGLTTYAYMTGSTLFFILNLIWALVALAFIFDIKNEKSDNISKW